MKKRLQRIGSCVLLCALLLAAALPAPVSAASTGFSDVPDTHWAADDIHRAVDLGLFQGQTKTRFGLGQPMTRAAAAVTVCRLFGWELVTPETGSYTDNQDPDAWYYSAVETAYANGAITRQTDTFHKRTTARAYCKIMQTLGSSLIYDHADFRLMDPDALDALALYHGDDLFLRGLITRLGFKCETVGYDRAERFAGESKYTLKKMLKLAAKGFTSGRMRPMSVAREPYTHTKELIGL